VLQRAMRLISTCSRLGDLRFTGGLSRLAECVAEGVSRSTFLSAADAGRWVRQGLVTSVGGKCMEPQQHRVLIEVAGHLRRIGSANDAEDHHYKEEAERMRGEACTSLRELLEEHPFVSMILPALRRELDTGHILGFGWSQLLDDLEEYLSALKEKGRSCRQDTP